MNNLKQLQNNFQNYLLNPGVECQTTWVSGGGRASPEYQLSVYANAYVSRLKEVLMNDYPAVSVSISDDLIDRLLAGYIRQYPSCYFSLRDYGQRFPVYLNGLVETDHCCRDLAWLPELARFEWALGQAFDAAESELVSEEDLASISAASWPRLRFAFCSCVQRIDLEWNVPAMWKSLTADPPQEIEALPGASKTAWLIWRQDMVTRFRSLEQDEQLLLDTLRNGVTFNDGCEILATRMEVERVPMRAAGLLKGWIQQGLVSSALLAD
ncbi:MAG: DNA-binding domain-containing protein [Candidatus Thiodiazotropha sp.]